APAAAKTSVAQAAPASQGTASKKDVVSAPKAPAPPAPPPVAPAPAAAPAASVAARATEAHSDMALSRPEKAAGEPGPSTKDDPDLAAAAQTSDATKTAEDVPA